MRMLEALKNHLDEIEITNDWEFQFVTNILERRENNPNYRLSAKQFNTLNTIYEKYCEV